MKYRVFTDLNVVPRRRMEAIAGGGGQRAVVVFIAPDAVWFNDRPAVGIGVIVNGGVIAVIGVIGVIGVDQFAVNRTGVVVNQDKVQ